MDYLGPWRAIYRGAKTERECVFCVIAAASDDEGNLIVHRAKFNFF
jgi:hypothetical protein